MDIEFGLLFSRHGSVALNLCISGSGLDFFVKESAALGFAFEV